MKTVRFLTNYVECGRNYSKRELVEFKDGTADRLIGAGVVELYVPTVPDQSAEVDSGDEDFS